MDLNKLNDYIVTLPTDELMSRYKNEDGKWGEECVQLCYLELAKRGDLIHSGNSQGVIRLDAKKYEKWCQDEDYLMGLQAQENEQYEDAHLFYEKSISNGNLVSKTMLGILYYHGNGVEQDYEKAYMFFDEALRNDFPLAAEWIATMYSSGKFVEKNEEKAKEIFLKYKTATIDLCICGNKYCQYMYGFDCLYGWYEEENVQEGILWLKKAADAGHKSAIVEIAKCFLNGKGYEQDTTQAINMLHDLCRTSSNKKAHHELAKIYYYGEYVEKDYKKAVDLFTVAAKRGFLWSQNYLGDMYYFGEGVEKDYEKAREWYEKSLSLNKALSIRRLGYIYHDKESAEDKLKAYRYFKTAADMNDEHAQYMVYYYCTYVDEFINKILADEYIRKSAENGAAYAYRIWAISEEDDSKFFELMMKAAEKEDAEAERIIGEAYVEAFTVPKDITKAMEWFNRAIEHGDIEAYVQLAKLHFSGNDVPVNTELGIELIEKAEQTIKESNEIPPGKCCETLADVYYKYLGNEKKEQAFYYYCRAYEKGKVNCLYDIAWMYFLENYEDKAFIKSTESFLELVEKEAHKKDEPGLSFILGRAYEMGYRVPVEKDAAIAWYTIAREKGSINACCKLANIYLGLRYRGKYKEAFSLAKEAHDANSAEGTYLLGICYEQGKGVEANKSMAKKLIKLAADKGNKDAIAKMKKRLF